MNKIIVPSVGAGLTFLFATVAQAGSAEWLRDPINNNWNIVDNWNPMTVPNGTADTATFAFSNRRSIFISTTTEVNGITFTPAATNPFTITVSPPTNSIGVRLVLSGVGIINDSGITQNFVATVNVNNNNLGEILFKNGATAGRSTRFTIRS